MARRSKKTVTRRLADGSLKVYSYDRAVKASLPRTVEAVVREYRSTPKFQGLAAGTRKNYERVLMAIVDDFGGVVIKDIKRRHVRAHRDQLSTTPAAANTRQKIWVILLQFAVDQEYIPHHPALRLDKFKGGEHARWPEEAVEHATTPGVLPEHLRRAIVLAVYTGQREGDCVRMTWADFDGTAIRVTQEKTGAKLWVPCHAALKAELEKWRDGATAPSILTRTDGTPWRSSRSFATMFSRGLHGKGNKRRPEFDGLVFHGLRKVAAARLAEAGCSVHEIAAITGHTTLAMVEHYTREADQRRRASAAIAKLENFRNGKRETNGL